MNSFQKISEHLFLYEDTCNVYVIKDGETALLIDGGSGAVLDQLGQIGCHQVEWVLHTHHHRDQCWGDSKLIKAGAKLAVPQYEKHLFEQAELFWQTRRVFDNYDDRNNFFTVAQDLPVHEILKDYENFAWHGYQFFVLPAKGHTQGSVVLITHIDGGYVSFTGDLMVSGGKLYQLHAMEYNYGDMVGGLFTLQSIQALRDILTGEVVGGHTFQINGKVQALPSHGSIIEDPLADIEILENSLIQLASLGRGLRIGGRESIPEMLYLPKPKFVELSEHLLWGGSWTCSFFYVLLSRSGKALFIDYGHAFHPHMHTFSDHNGLEVMRFIEHHLKELRKDYGIEKFDLVIPTHIHDDHTCGIPHLQRFYDTKCWALDSVAQVLSDPNAWASTPCTFHKPINIDRVLSDGEQFQWEEYDFKIFFAPGQTEFHSVVSTEIDGQKVAFTGDNYFMHEVLTSGQIKNRPFQTTVLRNSFQLGMHHRCIEVMNQVAPDLICPGHMDVWKVDQSSLRDYADFIYRKEKIFRKLVENPSDQHIDLFWVRMLPYLTQVGPEQKIEFKLLFRNNFEKKITYQAKLIVPIGWQTDNEFSSITIPKGGKGELKILATSPNVADGVRRLITAEICIEGISQGPVAECLVTVK